MPYINSATGAFGLSRADVQALRPNVSLPADGADLSDLGFPFYPPTEQPPTGWHQHAVEIAPTDVQRWSAKTAVSLAEAKARRVTMIKREALDRIRDLFGEGDMQALIFKEINLTARAAELANQKHGRALSPVEQAEADAIQAKWDAVKAVRADSNSAEARVAAATSVTAVVAVTW